MTGNYYMMQVPITNYDGNGVFEQSLYLKSDKSPLKEQVLKVVQKYRAQEEQYMNLGVWKEIEEVLNLCTDWPSLSGNEVSKNTFVNHPRWGQQPLTITLLQFEVV